MATPFRSSASDRINSSILSLASNHHYNIFSNRSEATPFRTITGKIIVKLTHETISWKKIALSKVLPLNINFVPVHLRAGGAAYVFNAHARSGSGFDNPDRGRLGWSCSSLLKPLGPDQDCTAARFQLPPQAQESRPGEDRQATDGECHLPYLLHFHGKHYWGSWEATWTHANHAEHQGLYVLSFFLFQYYIEFVYLHADDSKLHTYWTLLACV